jgi:aquaporin Z
MHESRMRSLRGHLPEYLIEAGGIGTFMVSALTFSALLEHPGSPLHRALPDAATRRALMGIAMGLTAVALVYSPWGKRSGAHFNPALTFTFFRLGKVRGVDALGYALFQCLGAVAGVLAVARLAGSLAGEPHVHFAVTAPGPAGVAAAFAAELAMSCGLMGTVLLASNHPRFARLTGLFAGGLVALYITWLAPISGMSMNPARTLGSATAARSFRAIWIYFTAPPLGMLLAAEIFVRLRGARGVRCAKLHHQNDQPCIFRCGYRSAA